MGCAYVQWVRLARSCCYTVQRSQSGHLVVLTYLVVPREARGAWPQWSATRAANDRKRVCQACTRLWPDAVDHTGMWVSPAIERLRFLNEAVYEGLISAHEFEEHKRSVFHAIPALHDAMRGPAVPDGGVPRTPKEYELALQRCIHSLVVLVRRLLVSTVANPNGRSDAATSISESSIARGAHFGPDADASFVRAESHSSDDWDDYDRPGFAFDRLGDRPRGGSSMQNRRLELDPLHVNVSGLWPAEAVAANAQPRREARQRGAREAGSRPSFHGMPPLPRPAGRVYVRASRNPPPPNAAGRQRHHRRQPPMAAIQVAPRRARCRINLNMRVN